jgi:glycosyltransferase involved in cell wall biosynthesis
MQEHDVAVAHSFDFYSNLMMIPAARMARTPVVIGSHRQLGDLLSKSQFWAMIAALAFCDRVVCNSQAAAESLRKRGMPGEKLTVIPNALPDAAFEMAVPVLPGKAGVLRVGMIARMNDSRKNHDGFLRVAAKVAARHPEVEFVLAGDGPLRSKIEEHARSAGIGDRVRFLGDRRDVPEVLAALDVSVLTSLSESLSNVIMESMAAGIPVVAGRIGGNAELVRDGATGFLVESENDEAFAVAIEKLLESSELRARLGARAKAEATSRFGVRRICAEYEGMYRAVLAEKGLAA